jgi:prevent-host-death family protein
MMYTMSRYGDGMSIETLGIADARPRLGSLVARAHHAHQPTMITRSTSETAVLISRDDYDDLLRLRREREVADVASLMDAAASGEVTMAAYDSADDLYADLGLPPGGSGRR